MCLSRRAARAMLTATLAVVPAAHAVVGGQFDAGNIYDNVGAFLAVDKATNLLVGFCSGTLIHERVFLSAAHCVRPPPGANPSGFLISVSLSHDRPTDPATWTPIATWMVHPSFPPSGGWQALTSGLLDIGVFVLAQPIRGVKPAALALPSELQGLGGTRMTIVGYGCNPIISGLARRSYGTIRFYDTVNDEWARFQPDPATSCTGDSGGPVFHENRIVATTSDGGSGFAYQARIDSPGALQWLAGIVAPLGPSLLDVVEFYNAELDHYFVSWVAAETAILDAGIQIKGWKRTGQRFAAYATPVAGASLVCRYYLPPAFGNSHFYGRGANECAGTRAKFPDFVLEDPQFMYMFLPQAGTCPPDSVPVYRVFSNRADANHRYMVDRAIRDQMTDAGWLAEGDGPDLVVMCGPPAAAGTAGMAR